MYCSTICLLSTIRVSPWIFYSRRDIGLADNSYYVK